MTGQTLIEQHLSDEQGGEPGDAREALYGQIMFLVFVTAVVLVTSAIALLAYVPHWWMLGVVLTVHVVATILVCIVIARALRGPRGPAQTHRLRRPGARRSGVTPALTAP